MSENLQPQSNQRFYVALGVVTVLMLVCIGAAAFMWSSTINKLPDPPPTATPLPPPVVSIKQIKSQAKLSTIKYSTVTEVYNETPPEGFVDEFLGNKERLLMLVYGDVQAGFDLEKLSEDDLWSDGERVRLILPAPEILNSSIDFDRTHVVFYENQLLLSDNNPNLQGEALKQAKEAVEKAALEDGILERANQYGAVYFENLLRSLGFTEVEVVTDAQIFKK